MELEKAKIETFYQQWTHHFEDFIGYANQTFSYVRLDPIWAHKVFNCHTNRSCKINGE
jgi:hypothetical protein